MKTNRRGFLAGLTALLGGRVEEPKPLMWDGTITHYDGGVKFVIFDKATPAIARAKFALDACRDVFRGEVWFTAPENLIKSDEQIAREKYTEYMERFG